MLLCAPITYTKKRWASLIEIKAVNAAIIQRLSESPSNQCWNFRTIYRGYTWRNPVGVGLSYRPARLHRLVESIPGLLKSLKIPSLSYIETFKCSPISQQLISPLRQFCEIFLFLPVRKAKQSNNTQTLEQLRRAFQVYTLIPQQLNYYSEPLICSLFS